MTTPGLRQARPPMCARANQASSDDSSGKKASHSPVSSAPTDSDSVANVEIVTSSGEHVGQVKLWAIGSDALLTKADSAFREKTFNAMALAAVVAVCISVVIGSFVSRMLTRADSSYHQHRQANSRRRPVRSYRTCAATMRSISWVRPSTRWPPRSRRI